MQTGLQQALAIILSLRTNPCRQEPAAAALPIGVGDCVVANGMFGVTTRRRTQEADEPVRHNSNNNKQLELENDDEDEDECVP